MDGRTTGRFARQNGASEQNGFRAVSLHGYEPRLDTPDLDPRSLRRNPAVADAGVCGIPDEEWGEQVKAVVELQPGVEATEGVAAELIAFCREHLAAFKCPRSVDFVDELPRHDNGKLYKRVLRDRYRQGSA